LFQIALYLYFIKILHIQMCTFCCSLMQAMPKLKLVGCDKSEGTDHGPHVLPTFKRATDMGLEHILLQGTAIKRKGKNTRLPYLKSMILSGHQRTSANLILDYVGPNLTELDVAGVGASILQLLQTAGLKLKVLRLKNVSDICFLQVFERCPNLREVYLSIDQHKKEQTYLEKSNFQFLEKVTVKIFDQHWLSWNKETLSVGFLNKYVY